MKFLGIELFARKPPPLLRSPLTDAEAVTAQLEQLKCNPSDVKMNSVSLGSEPPALIDVSRFANALANKGPRGATSRAAEALLVTAVGPSLAKSMLERGPVRERWEKLIEVADRSFQAQEVARGDALRLSRELKSTQAQALRRMAEAGQTASLPKFVAENTPDLSFRAVELCTDVKGGSFARDRALKEVQLQHALRDLFSVAGQTAVKEMSVKQLIADPATVFDAYDRFVEANDRALGALAAMTDAMGSAVAGDGDIRAHTGGRTLAELTHELRDDIHHMLEWHAALYSNADTKQLESIAETLLTRLASVADEVSSAVATAPATTGGTTDLATAPAYISEPCNRLLEVCSKSKPEVEIATITTVEELIRVLHRETGQGYGAAVRASVERSGASNRYNEQLTSSIGGRSKASLTVASSMLRKDFPASPMGIVADVFKRYIDGAANGHMDIKSAVITDRDFKFDVELGCHTGRLEVTYNAGARTYDLEWGMQEPRSGMGRINFCKNYFPKAGYEHSVNGWKHTATRTVAPADLPKALAFLIFSLENMRNVDISTPTYDETALMAIFESWYTTFDKPTFEPSSSALEDRVAELAARNTHLFRAAAFVTVQENEPPDEMIVRATGAFDAKHADALFVSPPDAATLKRSLTAATQSLIAQWGAPDPARPASFAPPEHLATTIDALATAAAEKVILDARGMPSLWTLQQAAALVGPVFQDT